MNTYICDRCKLTTERENQHDVFLCVNALKADNARLRTENEQLKTNASKLYNSLSKTAVSLEYGSPGDGEYKTGYADVYTEEEGLMSNTKNKLKKVAVADADGWYLWLADADGEMVEELPWGEDWPESVSAQFLREQGFTVEVA